MPGTHDKASRMTKLLLDERDYLVRTGSAKAATAISTYVQDAPPASLARLYDALTEISTAA